MPRMHPSSLLSALKYCSCDLVASDLRQIPNTQEVFLSPDSDVSFVVEILQRVDANDDENAVKYGLSFLPDRFVNPMDRFHFDSLAHDNSATLQEILHTVLPSETQKSLPPATPHPIMLVGQQEVQKFHGSTSDRVNILMALYRVEAKGVDIVFTANVPKHSGEEALRKTKQVFNIAADSFRISDFGLFA